MVRETDVDFDLEKKKEKVQFILEKGGLTNAPTLRVCAALDISGSMDTIINNGKLQDAFTQMMGITVNFDDDGELDVFKFDDVCEYVGTANTSNYKDYVARNRIRARGGTSYAPVITETSRFLFEAPAQPKTGFFGGLFSAGKKVEAPADKHVPALVMMLTDGHPQDENNTRRVLSQYQSHEVYFSLIGVGGGDFSVIDRLADEFDNVGDVILRDFGMSDDDVYKQLVSEELIGWLGARQTA